jgi:hypothetical protein
MKKTILNESVVGLEEVKLHVVLQSLGLVDFVGSDAFEHETSVRLRGCRATRVQEVYRVAKLVVDHPGAEKRGKDSRLRRATSSIDNWFRTIEYGYRTERRFRFSLSKKKNRSFFSNTAVPQPWSLPHLFSKKKKKSPLFFCPSLYSSRKLSLSLSLSPNLSSSLPSSFLFFVVPKTRRNPVLFFLWERIGERKKEWTREGDVAGENERAVGEMNAGREGKEMLQVEMKKDFKF